MAWVAVAAAAVSAGATLYATSKNSAAADKSAAADVKGAEIQSNALDKQIAAIRQGVAEGQGKYNQIAETAAPSIGYLKTVMNGSTALTPDQLQARQDLERQVTNSSQVAGSALRGSGRSFVDAMRAVEGDFTNKALSENRARADAAANTLQAPFFNSLGSSAAASATEGQHVGGVIANEGRVQAGGVTDAATTQANASLANAGLITNAAGTIAGQINQQRKTDALGRPSTQTPYPVDPGMSAPDEVRYA